MPARMTIEVFSISGGKPTRGGFAEAVRATIAKLQDTTPLVQKLADRGAASMRGFIDKQQAPDGSAYDALKPATIARKTKLGYEYPSVALKATLRMYDSIHGEVRSPTEGFAGPFALDAWYFPYQNQGAPRAGVPARRFIGVAAADIAGYESDIREFGLAAVENA